jgi:uncharacterized membrane protein
MHTASATGREGAGEIAPAVILLRRRRQTGLWLPAAVYLALALVLGLAMPLASWRALPVSLVASGSVLAILTSVASGMMALTAIVFSVVFLGIQFGATAYTPRLVHEMARQPAIGHALGVFAGTFVYSVVAIATVDMGGRSGVPRAAMWLAVVWLLASVALLLVVVGRPQGMTLVSVLDRIAEAGQRALARLPPSLRGDLDGPPSPGAPPPGPVTHEIRHRGRVSYLQTVDPVPLIEAARRAGGVIVLSRAMGDPLAPGVLVAGVVGAQRRVSSRLVRRGLRVGRARDLRYDPAFALRLLADVAIRALSPAVNDPTTAVQVLDELEELLILIGRSRFDEKILRDRHGAVRLVCATPSWDDVLALALAEIIRYGRDAYQVARRMGTLVQRLLDELPPTRHPAVTRLARQRQTSLEDTFPRETEREAASALDPQGLGHTSTPS